MNRRTFLKIIGIGGAASLAIPVFADQPDVKGWRFGVWELQYRYGENYWARCDCGTEQAVGLDELLGIDALSCAHVRHRGFFSINPDAMICQSCGGHRRFFFNGDGLRIWRCGNCEEADIRAYLRREYGPASSVQFTANVRRANAKAKFPLTESYDRFLASLNERIKHVLIRDETTLKSIHIDAIEEIDGEEFRFVRLWVEELEKPLTWYQPY